MAVLIAVSVAVVIKMQTIRLKTAAKVNLSLDILGRLENGYHELDMIVSPVSLFDDITISKGEQGIVLHCDQGIPSDERNIAYRAAQLIMEGRDIPGVEMTICKHIPAQAGLGGGSSDAAAALYGINDLYNLKLTKQELMTMGLKLGADVPLFFADSAVRAKGVGEKIDRITVKSSLHMVILKPEAGLSTAEVYGLYDAHPKPMMVKTDEVVRGLQSADLQIIKDAMGNVMEPAAETLCPEVQKAIDALKNVGAIAAQMSGSGSAVFGIFENEQAARNAEQQLKMKWPMCAQVQTLDRAIEIFATA